MVRLVSILYGGLAAPLLAVLIGQISSMLSSLLALMVISRQRDTEKSELDNGRLIGFVKWVIPNLVQIGKKISE